jgi:hypothetical protein
MPELYFISEADHKLLKDQIAELHRLLTERDGGVISDWLTLKDAAQYFKNNGKPIPYTTFKGWAEDWIANKVLVQGQNCMYADRRLLISKEFLKARMVSAGENVMRKVG